MNYIETKYREYIESLPMRKNPTGIEVFEAGAKAGAESKQRLIEALEFFLMWESDSSCRPIRFVVEKAKAALKKARGEA